MRDWAHALLAVGLRPYRRVMLVVAPNSSGKTTFSESMADCLAHHWSRLAFTSGRSCSAARRTFFNRHPMPGDGIPQGTQGNHNPQFRLESSPEFLHCLVGGRHDPLPQLLGKRVELRIPIITRRPGLDLAILTPSLSQPSNPGLTNGVLLSVRSGLERRWRCYVPILDASGVNNATVHRFMAAIRDG